MPLISAGEKQRRRLAVENAIGTHVMEGLPPDMVTRRIMERYAEGELTEAEFGVAMEQHAQDVLTAIRARALAGAA